VASPRFDSGLPVRGQGNQFRLDAGTGLPEGLLAVLHDPRWLSLLLFLSEDCPARWNLLDDVRAAPIERSAAGYMRQ
jgi:hypothetical protein